VSAGSPGPLTRGEHEQVRLHAYHSERVLDACPALRPLARLAGSHGERCDGSGYHRGSRAGDLPAAAWPAGLSERECEVLGLIARGMATKQVARQLGISPKTCDHHIQRLYRKTGLSTRAGATLFALEHGLIDQG
jgi:DNA-binding NarL/FixJ family response regulator